MLPSTFEFILRKIGKKLIRSIEGNEMIPAEKQLLLSLWRFATPDSYRYRYRFINMTVNFIIQLTMNINSYCSYNTENFVLDL